MRKVICFIGLLLGMVFFLPGIHESSISLAYADELEASGNYSVTSVTQYSSDLAVNVQNLTDGNYFALFRNGTIIGSIIPVTDKVRSIPQMFSDPTILKVFFYSDSAGTKPVAKATLNDSQELIITPINLDNCFIATAAFGSKFEPSVVLLRHFRDKCLLSNSPGQVFVRWYYHYSPPLAKLIAGSGFLKITVRILLIPLILLAFLCLHPLWIPVLIFFAVTGKFLFMQGKKKRNMGAIYLILLIGFVSIVVPAANAATIYDVGNNSLRIGNDLYALNSDNLTDANINASLTKLNQVYFKIGGLWYDVLAAQTDAEIGTAAKALSSSAIAGWTTLDKWYKTGNEIITITNIVIPAAPADLTATAAGASQINLSWSAVTGANSYNIYRADSQAGSYSLIAPSSTNSYNNTGLSASTAYWYKVTAVNSAGESTLSAPVNAATAMNPPETPSGLTAAAAGISQINLSWTAVTGASSYNVYRASVQAGPYAKIAASSTNSYSNSGLTLSTAYWYRVAAVNSSGESNLSSSANATTLASFETYLTNAQTYYDNAQYDEAIGACNAALLISTSNADIYVIRGASYIWLNQYESALNDFNAALAIDSNNADAYSGKGWYYLYTEKYDSAIPQFTNAIQHQSALAINYEGRGICYAESGDAQSALQDFSSFIQYKPNNADAYFLRAATYFQLDNYDACITDYTEAIELNSQYSAAYNNRGAAYYMLGQNTNAINDYQAAIKLDSDYFLAFNNLGVAYNDLGQYQDAVDAYNTSISIESKYALAYSNRGKAFAYLKQYDLALSSWAQAIALDSELEPAYNCRGWYYCNSGQYSLAVSDFTTALQLSADDSEDDCFNPWASVHYQVGSGRTGAFNGRGWSDYFLKQYSSAVSDFSNCINLNTNYINAYDGRAWSYYRLGSYGSSISDFTKCITLDSTCEDAFNGRAWSYLESGSYGSAINDFTTCISMDANNEDAYCGRGYSYYFARQYGNAVNDFTKCISFSPNDDNYYDWRGWCYLELGYSSSAEADFKQCLALNSNNADAKEGLAALGYSSYSVQSVEENPVQDPDPTLAPRSVPSSIESDFTPTAVPIFVIGY